MGAIASIEPRCSIENRLDRPEPTGRGASRARVPTASVGAGIGGSGERRQRAAAGFTLIELMVVVGVLVFLGILASSVLMDTSGWLAHYRLRSAAKGIAMVLQAAKMEAIKSSIPCAVAFGQALDDGTQIDCLAFSDADGDLEYDDNGNGVYDPPGDEMVVKRLDLSFYTGVGFDPEQGSGSGLSFPANDDGKPSIGFNSRGLPVSNDGGPGGGTIFLVNSQDSRLRVVINHAGSIRIEND